MPATQNSIGMLSPTPIRTPISGCGLVRVSDEAKNIASTDLESQLLETAERLIRILEHPN
jgi:hypothetical protein